MAADPPPGPGDPTGPGDPPGAVVSVPGHPHGPLPGGLRIPTSELQWRFSGSGGPGGQHVNTANTRAEVRWDLAASPSVPEAARGRLLRRLGPVVAVAASDTRSQARNRALAVERLRDQVAAALVGTRARTATRPTRSSVRRRLEGKRRTSERKEGRRRPDLD